MLLKQVLDNYVTKQPIYSLIKYASKKELEGEQLPSIYLLTQYIIDSLIKSGNKRIAIILPDDDFDIIPLILTKYFANIQYDKDYAGSVLDEIETGQHLRLGKAVVEYLGIDDENRIIFRVERKNPVRVTCPINGIHYLFEKTEGAISSWKVWCDAKKLAEKKLANANDIIDELKIKRTALRKTIVFLSVKNKFKDFLENLYINGQYYEDIATYGEIDLDKDELFKLYNKGRLDCLPSISVTAKIEELYYLLKNRNIQEKVEAIYSSMDKFDEIINNPDAFKWILKKDLPFVVFVSESDFEECPVLSNYGFDIWHWKPSTMKSEVFLKKEDKNSELVMEEGLFDRISKKISMAASSNFLLKTYRDSSLKRNVWLINHLSKEANEVENVIRQLIRRLWVFQKEISWIICKIEGIVSDKLKEELKEISDCWEEQKVFYAGQQIESFFNEIIELFRKFIDEINIPGKCAELLSFVQEVSQSGKDITIVVPNKYSFAQETFKEVLKVSGNCHVKIKALSEFYLNQSTTYNITDYLVLTWFDKDEYIKIKQTYCYNNLVFILYDFENRWREGFLSKFDDSIPHESIKDVAQKVQFSQLDILEKPFDSTITQIEEDYEEISDYNISNRIIRSTIRNKTTNIDQDDKIECLPVLLSEDKIAYFYPTHDVIDVTPLMVGDLERPVKKDAIKLKKGDRILVRQSNKDIIKERADILMEQAGEVGHRDVAELWVNILNIYGKGRSIKQICKALNNAGGECSFQQVMYWLMGGTIMPRDKNILKAIGKIASEEESLKDIIGIYMQEIDEIFEAGKTLQAYHQKAGRWLTAELKNKAQDIKTIGNSVPPKGIIEGIGEVNIYTIEDVLDKEYVERGTINRIEDLY